MNMHPTLRLVAGFAFTLLSASLGQAQPTTVAPPSVAAEAGLKAGDVAPEFAVTGPKGETLKLSDLRGKIVLVDVSATWCGPCQAAMPNNDRLTRAYRDQNVVFVGVTASDTKAAYDGWVKRNTEKYAFTMYFDPAERDGWDKSVFKLGYKIRGFPTLFIVGPDGRVAEVVSGGGPGMDYRVDRALARLGVKVDLAALPPEEKPAGPKTIPAMGMMGMGGAASKAWPPENFGSVRRGQPVPDFAVQAADGSTVKFSALKGRPALVHFATSNGPMPWVAKLAGDYRAAGVQTLVVFSSTEREAFDAWVKANPAPGFQVSWDPAGKAWGENVTNTYFGVGMYPATLVADAEGRMISGTIGMGKVVPVMMAGALELAGVKLTAEDAAAVTAAKKSAPMAAAMIKPLPAAKTAEEPRATLRAGEVAPDFAMQDVTGKTLKLSDYKGKVVVLDFWATWCGPCVASFPHTQEIAKKYADQGVVVLASGTSDTSAKFKEWIPKNQPKYPDMIWAFDPHERGSATFGDRASAKLYGVRGIPTQFVIDRAGKITAVIVGNGGADDARTEAALAAAGVKVPDDIVAQGRKALAADAEAERERQAAAEAEKINPTPKFSENYGKLAAGQPLPDPLLLAADGREVRLSEVTKGKTTVISIWGGHGVPDEILTFTDAWARRYADQGVQVIGFLGYAGKEAVTEWRTKNAGKISFAVYSDPLGGPPVATKEREAMTDEEKKAFGTAQMDYFKRTVPLQLTGGAMAPVPNNLVVDAKGNMLGFYVGGGAGTADSLGNLLLRAGIKLAAEDMPPKVFTKAETKPAAPEPEKPQLAIGALAPDFTAYDLGEKPVKLSDYRGKVVVLDFWATWCGPCMAAMPHTQEVAAHYKDQGVVVLGSCTSDTRAKFEQWVRKNQTTYPDIVWTHDKAERGATRASYALYGVRGIPTQYVIDREGRVVDIVVGYMKGEVLLDDALRKAGIKVADEVPAKAEADRKRRSNM